MSYQEELNIVCDDLLTRMENCIKEDGIFEEEYSSLLECTDYEHFSPVERVEKLLGISGISQEYKFPDNISPKEFESNMRPLRIYEMIERGHSHGDYIGKIISPVKEDALTFAKKLYCDLEKLNPEIKNFPNNGTIHNYVAILSGVCSKFPQEDIHDFCDSVARDDTEKNEDLNKKRLIYSNKISHLIEEKGYPKDTSDKELLSEKMQKKQIFLNWCPNQKSFEKVYQALNRKLEGQSKKMPTLYNLNLMKRERAN